MMDERVKETYRKIYTELFSLTMLGCAVSIVVKIAWMGLDATACIPEYPILVGSPLYLAVRSRMLGVTQAQAMTARKPFVRRLSAVIGLIVALFVYCLIMRGRDREISWGNAFIFLIPFILCFVAAQIGYQKLEERRQKKLDSKYEE